MSRSHFDRTILQVLVSFDLIVLCPRFYIYTHTVTKEEIFKVFRLSKILESNFKLSLLIDEVEKRGERCVAFYSWVYLRIFFRRHPMLLNDFFLIFIPFNKSHTLKRFLKEVSLFN